MSVRLGPGTYLCTVPDRQRQMTAGRKGIGSSSHPKRPRTVSRPIVEDVRLVEPPCARTPCAATSTSLVRHCRPAPPRAAPLQAVALFRRQVAPRRPLASLPLVVMFRSRRGRKAVPSGTSERGRSFGSRLPDPASAPASLPPPSPLPPLPLPPPLSIAAVTYATPLVASPDAPSPPIGWALEPDVFCTSAQRN